MRSVASSQPPLCLDPAQLRSACEAAERALRRGGRDRHAIDACFAALVAGFEEQLLASVYIRDHDRLWLITQHGYPNVLDGFSMQRGVMARAVRTGETQFVAEASTDPDFLEATPGILAEVTVAFGSGSESSVQGAMNVETVGVTLPPDAPRILEPLAQALGERIEEMRDALDVDVARLVRLCVHASTLRGSTQIAEFAARTVGRLLMLDCVQLELRSRSGTFELASFWRRDSSGLEPLAESDVQALALLEDETGVDAAFHLFDIRLTGVGDAQLAAPWIVWFPLTVAGVSVGAIVGRLTGPAEFRARACRGRHSVRAAHCSAARRLARASSRAASRGHGRVDGPTEPPRLRRAPRRGARSGYPRRDRSHTRPRRLRGAEGDQRPRRSRARGSRAGGVRNLPAELQAGLRRRSAHRR